MASALSYVSKFKSFLILFLTPILLLPLVILMPAKVSCISAAPGRPPGIPELGRLAAGTRELRVPVGRCQRSISRGAERGAHPTWGSQIPGHLVSTGTQKLAQILATQPLAPISSD